MTAPAVLGPTQPVDAPPVQPPVSGLVSLARRPVLDDDRWMLGYQYRPETPAPVVRNQATATDFVGANIGATNTDATRVTVIPVYHTVDDVGSVMSRGVDQQGRATRRLEAYTTKLVAHEFWTGEIAKNDGLPNPILASAATTDITAAYGGPLPVQSAVAALMQALSDNGGTGEGMIHCSKYVGLRMPPQWENGETLGEHGFVVVADAGYPGTGPTGQAGPNWMYATEFVNVRLGPIEIVPQDERYSIDRTANTATYRAQRVGGVDFAGPVFAIQVTP